MGGLYAMHAWLLPLGNKHVAVKLITVSTNMLL